MRLSTTALIILVLLNSCKKEDNPLIPPTQELLAVKVENDSLMYSLTIPKAVYSSGDSLNASFAIENKTSNLIRISFNSSEIIYSVLNDSSRKIISYPKQSSGSGFFGVPPNGFARFKITQKVVDDLNIPVRAGLYKLLVGVNYHNTPSLTLTFTVK